MLNRSRTSDTQIILRELVGPRMADESIKITLANAARICGLSYWRIYDIWYGRAKKISDEEEAAIINAAKRKNLRTVKNELAELRTKMARLEALLSRTDEDFFSPHITALRETSR